MRYIHIMRIFYAVGKRPNQGLLSSDIWYSNLFLSLKDLGHDIVEFDFNLEPYYAHADPSRPQDVSFNKANQAFIEKELLNQIELATKQKPVDLFFSYFYSSFVRPKTIQRIRDLGITTMNWYCNAAHQFHLVEEISRVYDFSLVPEKFRMDDYRNAGANPIYCQEAANPNIYMPFDLHKEFDVSFVGSPGANRPEYIHDLIKAGVNTDVWGVRWLGYSPPSALLSRLRWHASRIKKHLSGMELRPILPRRICHPPLTDMKMIQLYSQSKICLGFTATNNDKGNRSIKQIRLREFEATMSGAFYMLEYIEDIEEFFNVGKEIVCFHNGQDLVDKVKYYLKHHEEREQIRLAGLARAQKDHTWQKRLSAAFREAGLL